MRPATRYARIGDLHIAYEVLGEGPRDLVYVPTSRIYGLRLAAFSRLLTASRSHAGERECPISTALRAAGVSVAVVLISTRKLSWRKKVAAA